MATYYGGPIATSAFFGYHDRSYHGASIAAHYTPQMPHTMNWVEPPPPSRSTQEHNARVQYENGDITYYEFEDAVARANGLPDLAQKIAAAPQPKNPKGYRARQRAAKDRKK